MTNNTSNSTNTGTWEPGQMSQTVAEDKNNYTIDDAFLQKIINFMSTLHGNDVHSFLSNEEQAYHCNIMKQPKDLWVAISESLPEEDIVMLIRFFTLAEMQYPQWRANEFSPVIGLAKGLRKKGKKMDKALLTWIKTESDNKFLPNGPL